MHGKVSVRPARYRARDARKSALHRLVLDHLEEFALRLRAPPDKRPWPRPAAEDHFRRFLECGIVRYGVVRFRCPRCGDDLFVAFSCKLRLCPSCNAKRALIVVSNALDRLFPETPYRQWVLVVPKRLRFFMNRRPELPGEVRAIFARAIEFFLKRRSQGGSSAQLHFIQNRLGFEFARPCPCGGCGRGFRPQAGRMGQAQTCLP